MSKLKKCRECGHDVARKAKACPGCGASKPGVRQYSLWKALVVLATGFWLWSFFPEGTLDRSEDAGVSAMTSEERSIFQAEQAKQIIVAKLNGRRLTNAKILAEQAIRKNLKNPNGASFSGYPDTRAGRLQGFDHRFVVKGWVDAQNNFGATIRTPYEVIVEFEPGSSDSARVVTADIFDN